MIYARDKEQLKSTHTAEVLIDTFPWLKLNTGKTIVIKYGGAAMVDGRLRDAVMGDIVLLKIMGVNPVIVHGGGAAITENMQRFGLEVEFKNGQRVTTPEAMDVVKMTLIGKVNEELVLTMNDHGNLAVGVNGTDAGTMIAEQASEELGRVGKVVEVNPGYIESLIASDYVPIIASVGMGTDGNSYNINADVAAGAIAGAIGAHKIIFLSDVDGYYEDINDPDSLISDLTLEEVQGLIASGKVAKGMIPKLNSCLYALEQGVSRAHIINGTMPHSILLELLTSAGVGTVIHTDDSPRSLDAQHPLGQLASRLSENM